MSSASSTVSLRTAATGLLAAAFAGTSVAPVAQASRVRCVVTSAGTTTIASQDGFANALVELAEFACNDSGEGTVLINERVTGVASAMAEAVAEVIGTCSGEGDAQATVSGLARAEARAEAVGTASARVLATSEVCGRCTSALDAFSTAVENVAATAVAEASIAAEFMFQEGEEQVFTASDIQREVESNIIELLSTVTGEIHTSAEDGCSANAVTKGQAGTSIATCDVAISADDINESIDAVADAGVAVQALTCSGSGDGSEAEARLIAREIATAVAQGVVQADSFCESNGGPGTISCGLSNGTINAVATATASAFVTAMAEARGPECDCDAAALLTATEAEEIMAEASTSALAQTCAEGVQTATESDFQKAVEEAMGFAIAEAIATAVAGAECTASVAACVDAGECVERSALCAGPGIDGVLACCDPDDVCASALGAPTHQCMSRAVVDAIGGADVLECDP